MFIIASLFIAMKLFVFLLFLFAETATIAQQKLDNTVEFNDGVYLSVEEFLSNRPSIKIEDVELEYIDEVFDTEHAKAINVIRHNDNVNEKVWAVCIEGRLYIRLAASLKSFDKYEKRFVKDNTYLKILSSGEICVFSLPIYMTISNSLGAFGGVGALASSKVSNSPSVSTNNVYDGSNTKWYFISLKDGNVYTLEIENFINYIKHDTDFNNIVIADKKAKKKLLYYVSKYNEKNPFYIQPANEN